MNTIGLIDELGGTFAVAKIAGVKPPSVSGWRATGRIPRARLILLASVAEQRGIATRKSFFPEDAHLIWPDLQKDVAA